MKFFEGEEVLAKQPNSTGFEKGKVVNVRGSNYRVQFKGGLELNLKEGDIKVIFTFLVYYFSYKCVIMTFKKQKKARLLNLVKIILMESTDRVTLPYHHIL